MSDEVNRLEAEAELHRQRLDDTLTQLEGKLSATALVDEFTDYLRKGEGANMMRNLTDKVRDNPIALGLISAGVAWLLLGSSVRRTVARHRHDHDDWQTRDYRDRDSFERDTGYRSYSSNEDQNASDSNSRAHDHSILHDAKDRLYEATHKASDTAQSAGRWAREHLHDGTDAARRTAAAARRGGRYVSREGRRLVEEGSTQFMTTLREQPLLVGAAAIAIGAAIGAVLPATQRENELMGKTRDRLRDKAADLGDDVVDRAKHVAQSAMQAADDKAGEVGLKPEGGETLADKVSTVAEAAVDAAKDDAKKQGLL
jgi:hypothetical protein